ncbi:hypothetical protein [Haladaptatus sp. W1]|uniref:hypothetical protein n=1 Tax=Haladaptatus sp. W1 TaxID=1897478 RepID=UPI001112F53D|nr:hypothetical protein [Haladaptatus sp. W1]
MKAPATLAAVRRHLDSAQTARLVERGRRNDHDKRERAAPFSPTKTQRPHSIRDSHTLPNQLRFSAFGLRYSSLARFTETVRLTAGLTASPARATQKCEWW